VWEIWFDVARNLILPFNRCTAEHIFEYQWPQGDPNAEFYVVQEQISDYLGVVSFKRKHPGLFPVLLFSLILFVTSFFLNKI
jgi:hypothetical protein